MISINVEGILAIKFLVENRICASLANTILCWFCFVNDFLKFLRGEWRNQKVY